MFEKILQELKTKYSHLGLSEKILKVWAKKLSLTVKEETEIATAIEAIEADLEIIQSLTDQNRTLQAELKKLQEGGKKEEPKESEPPKDSEEPKEDDKIPAWAKVLIEQNKTTQEQLAAFQSEKRQEKSAKTFVEKAKELGISETFYKSHVRREFKDDDEMTEFLNALKEDMDEFRKEIGAADLKSHTSPIFGKAAGKDDVSSDMKAYLDSEKEKNG